MKLLIGIVCYFAIALSICWIFNFRMGEFTFREYMKHRPTLRDPEKWDRFITQRRADIVRGEFK